MLDEYNALIKNNTWVLVPRPSDANIVLSLWLFRHKHNADGSLNRYKARLVANGSIQIVRIDVDETFSPVVKPATIRTVLSLTISRHWPVHQLDVKNILSLSSKREFTLSRFTTIVYCDNVSAVYLSSNPVQHQRTKHIEIDIYFVRDLVTTGHIRVLHVPSRYQYADIFTKGLPTALFDEFRDSLSVRSSLAQTAGGC
ncbi:ribonuclease H-like domain-containing protein [Tanacetum coccineum]